VANVLLADVAREEAGQTDKAPAEPWPIVVMVQPGLSSQQLVDNLLFLAASVDEHRRSLAARQ